MHRQRILAQILLMLSILNSVLAAPAISAREVHEARRALAVRVPSAERVVAVLQKRPEQGLDTLPTNVATTTVLDPIPEEHNSEISTSGPNSQHFNSEISNSGPNSQHTNPEIIEEDPHLQYSQPLSGIQPIPPPEPKPAEVSSAVPSKAPSSIPAWKENIITPQKIKALKIVSLAGLATSAYLSLLLPEIFNSQKSQNNNGQNIQNNNGQGSQQ
ncbi:hypothetical protein BGY98DRAFT_958539 [Russula aff. rugulosa BPL654]|nr:hypothetical protein BGY98DRAFT_958539 [Russula aff. rugulosa BPL654]